MGRTKGSGILESGRASQPPAVEDGTSKSPRIPDLGDGRRRDLVRQPEKGPGSAASKIQGTRGLAPGRRMANRQASRTDSSGDGRSHHRGRETGSGQVRAPGHKAARGSQQSPETEIGNRQRARSRGEEARESKPKSSREDRSKGLSPERGRHPSGEVPRRSKEARKRRRPSHSGSIVARKQERSGAYRGRSQDRGEGKASPFRRVARSSRAKSLEEPLMEERGKRRQRKDRRQSEPREERWSRSRSSHRQPGRSGEEDIRDEMARMFRNWLQDEPPSNLSTAQMARHLVLQFWRSDGPLSRYMEWSLQSPVEQGGKVQNLFPLPLWYDDRESLREIIDEEKVKDAGDWRRMGPTKSKAAKALKGQGLRAWHGLAVICLNFLHGHRPCDEKPRLGSAATGPQEAALNVIWSLVKTFVEEKGRGGVPRSSQEDWGQEVKSMRISYTGEVIEKALPLTLEQILPALPSKEHGGTVDIMEVLPEYLQEALKHPEDLILEEPAGQRPKPRIHCAPDEWPAVVKALMDRGVVAPVENCPEMEGEKLLNGAFGVPKAGKFTENGEPVLRVIMDLRATNFFMAQLQGDTNTLTGAASFQRIIVEEENQLLVSGEDLTSAFYLFRLPAAWSEYMVLDMPVPRASLGLPGEGTTCVGLTVLPMGWHSAVGLMQSAHRQIALRSVSLGGAGLNPLAEISKTATFPDMDDQPAWSIYLDDTTIIEQVEKAVAAELEGKIPEEQKRLRAAYEWLGIPRNTTKALERQKEAERLGALIDGETGVLRTTSKRNLDLMGLGSWIRSLMSCPRKALQVYAGKAVHILQFRRCLFSVMDVIFTEISKGGETVRVTKGLADEMLLLEGLLPLAQTNLKAKINPVVTCSDACESGGGSCFSSRLSRAGLEEATKLMELGVDDPSQSITASEKIASEKILLVDLFAGIGGLGLSLERAGIKFNHALVVESDQNCRRLLRRKMPGSDFCNDVKKVDKKMVQDAVSKVPGISGIVVGGGSPCQGLSKLSSGREHLKDERSALFYEQARIFELVEKVAKKMKIWCVKLGENVVADGKDVDEMSGTLKMKPVLAESGEVSLVRRPRLYWVSPSLEETEDMEIIEGDRFDRLKFEAFAEPLDVILGPGCEWPGHQADTALRMPTFTRAIRRKKPPPCPAGLDTTDAAARERWTDHEFRYPPYVYREEFMVKSEDGLLRPMNAEEREVLMGYGRGYTKALFKKAASSPQEEVEQEDARCAALGNSFHTNTVAVIFDAIFSRMRLKKRLGVKRIVSDFVQKEGLKRQQAATVWDFPEDDAVSEGGKSEKEDDGVSLQGEVTLKFWKEASDDLLTEEELKERAKMMSSKLVAAFVRRQEFRGSDIRLDTGSLYRPDAFPRGSIDVNRWLWHVAEAYEFRIPEHINVLELKALVRTFEWRARATSFNSCRALHLTDSQVALATSVKGRSSSRSLNRLLRKFAALQVAAGLYPLLGWVESEDNPADEPSRRYA